MASPQKENGYTAIANELLEALAMSRIPGESRQILDVIFRQTYGFNRKFDKISGSFFEQMTGIDRRHQSRAIKWLITHNVVVSNIRGRGRGQITEYGIQKDFHQWKCAKNGAYINAPNKAHINEKEMRQKVALNAPKMAQENAPKMAHTKYNLKTTYKIQGDFLELMGEKQQLKKLGWDDLKIKNHFLMRKIPEAEIDKVMGKDF